MNPAFLPLGRSEMFAPSDLYKIGFRPRKHWHEGDSQEPKCELKCELIKCELELAFELRFSNMGPVDRPFCELELAFELAFWLPVPYNLASVLGHFLNNNEVLY